MYLKKITLLIVVFMSGWAFAQAPDVKRLMTEKEFQESGLNTLSEQQIKALNQWLIRYTAEDAPVIGNTSIEVKETAKAAIKSQIVGKFTGWNRDTVFTLKNGQVWKVRHNQKYRYSSESPEVEITKNFLGFYTLKLVETGRTIGVKRVR